MSEDRDLRAAEYVLGTMPGPERADFEHALEREPTLREAVAFWEERLADLAGAIPEVAPAPEVWDRIERALGPSPALAVVRPAAANASGSDLATLDIAAMERLRRSRSRWRGAAIVAGSLAAGLVLFVAAVLRDPGSGDSYVAVVNRGGDLPALIVQVDTKTSLVRVRSVTAEAPADRSLELWYIGDGQAPRSLGIIDDPKRQLALPAVARGADLARATLAVTVEPKGGSSTGKPTGSVIYSGRLIRD